jgi:hypothetical protein
MPKVGKVGKGNKSSGRGRPSKNREDTKRMMKHKKPSGDNTLRGGLRPAWEDDR